jgi:hypothetical protein
MPKSYLPGREAELLTWVNNLIAKVAVGPETYGLSNDQAGALANAVNDFATAYQTANDPATRSPANIEAKNNAKDAMLVVVRALVRICQASPAMTDDKRAALGITIPDTDPTPVPVPDIAPQMDVVSVVGRTVHLRLRDAATGKRKKPAGVATATVLSYVGENIPATLREWTFEGNDTRLDTEVAFGSEFTPATKVWLTAFWSNRRGESGPACAPVSTHLGFGVTANPGELSDQADAA